MKPDANSICIFLLLLTVYGCSPERPPADFVQQVSQADRVVVTNLYRPVFFTVSGDELQRLRLAVTNAIRDKNNYSAVFDFEVQFYVQTNLLTVIHLQDRAFSTKAGLYSDESGVLKAVYKEWEDRGEKDSKSPLRIPSNVHPLR
jgi:hypothetical protein